jgi:hypothetical protein
MTNIQGDLDEEEGGYHYIDNRKIPKDLQK